MSSEGNAQTNAINHLIQNLNGVYRMAMQHPIRELPDILQRDELPERMMVVELGWSGDPSLLVVTDRRLIFVTERTSFTSTPKVRVRHFPCNAITSVDYKPGLAKHEVTVHVNGKKERFNLRWWDGKFEARQIAEYLLSKVGNSDCVPECESAALSNLIKEVLSKVNWSGPKILREQMEAAIERNLSLVLSKDDIVEHTVIAGHGFTKGLLLSTEHSIVFVGFAAHSPKVMDFPFNKLMDAEFTKTLAEGKLKIDLGGKSETFNVERKDRENLKLFTDHLQDRIIEHRGNFDADSSKVNSNTNEPNSSQPVTSKSPFAKDDKTAKAYAVENAIRSLNDLTGSERTLVVGGELKRLPNILGVDELPERLMPATYDERRGLQVSKTTNRRGLLVATDRRLIFVDKDMRTLKVDDFSYDKISYVEVSSGMLSGEITIHVSGEKEVFEGDFLRVERLGRHLRQKIAPHTTMPAKSRADVINEAVLNLGHTQKAMDSVGVRNLPEVLEDDELPEKMTFVTHDYCAGALVATASRVLFLPSEGMTPPVGASPLGVKSFSYGEIESVESSTGMFFGKIIIGLSGGKEVFDSSTNGNVRDFDEYIRAKITISSDTPAPDTPSPQPAVLGHLSVADELEKLHGLVIKGILTQEEFEVEKKKLLNG